MTRTGSSRPPPASTSAGEAARKLPSGGRGLTRFIQGPTSAPPAWGKAMHPQPPAAGGKATGRAVHWAGAAGACGALRGGSGCLAARNPKYVERAWG
jgi:hypothetical protein